MDTIALAHLYLKIKKYIDVYYKDKTPTEKQINFCYDLIKRIKELKIIEEERILSILSSYNSERVSTAIDILLKICKTENTEGQES